MYNEIRACFKVGREKYGSIRECFPVGSIKAGKIKLKGSPSVSYHCSLQIFGSQKRGLFVPAIATKCAVLATFGAIVIAAKAWSKVESSDFLVADMTGFGLYTTQR